MSIVSEVRAGLTSIAGRLTPIDIQPAYVSATETGPNHPEEIPWDKFRRYFAPLPQSIAKVRPEQISFGDIYRTTRISGRELIILPLMVSGWREKRSLVDMLLILGFNAESEVVGMRTVAMDIANYEFVGSQGAIASAICNDGIASAIEQIRTRTSQEALMMYRDRGRSFTHLRHYIDDENIKVMEILEASSKLAPTNTLLRQRFDHASDDRPRWMALFDPEQSGNDQQGRVIYVQPDEDLERGFRSSERTVFQMTRITASPRTAWNYQDLGSQERSRYANVGLLDKDFITNQMTAALNNPPEIYLHNM